MRTRFFQAFLVLSITTLVFSACSSQQKTVCAPEKMRREIKFKGFL
jgi:predicted component of type VI protein secretion system